MQARSTSSFFNPLPFFFPLLLLLSTHLARLSRFSIHFKISVLAVVIVNPRFFIVVEFIVNYKSEANRIFLYIYMVWGDEIRAGFFGKIFNSK